MALYRNSERNIEVTGNLALENIFIFKGNNETKAMVYLSEKPNNSADGNWNSLKTIEMKRKEKNQPKTVVINITNDYFFDFLLKKGVSFLNCENKVCGCNNKLCNENKKRAKISSFKFNRNEKTLTLDLEAGFDFEKTYSFQMDLDAFFKSELKLQFKIIRE